MYLRLILTLSCFSQVFSVPVSAPRNCTPSCQWTQWFNVDHPTDQLDGGDWETLDNIRVHGYHICQVPKAANCRSVRFPFIPYTELFYETQCDPSIGLICLNKDNVDQCIDFEVQLLCCTCEGESPKITVHPVTPSVITEIPAIQCESPRCSWTQWFNTHRPTPGPDGGEYEKITTIRRLGYSVCDFPKEIHCRLERFPYIPLTELYSVQECSVSHGLSCHNKKKQDNKCPDFEIQFLCCACDTTNRKHLVIPEHATNEPPTSTEETSATQDIFSESDQGSGMVTQEGDL
ncbi:mucin-5AC-like [Mantella aurantiaca]